jgi:hypothetical protein
MIEHVASSTFENVEIRPYFPIDFPPRNPISFSDKSYKLFEIPRLVNDMLRPYLAIGIDIGLSLCAMEYFSLTHGE